MVSVRILLKVILALKRMWIGLGLRNVSDQILLEIKARAEEIDQMRYGEIAVKIQDGKPIRVEIKMVYKADSN